MEEEGYKEKVYFNIEGKTLSKFMEEIKKETIDNYPGKKGTEEEHDKYCEKMVELCKKYGLLDNENGIEVQEDESIDHLVHKNALIRFEDGCDEFDTLDDGTITYPLQVEFENDNIGIDNIFFTFRMSPEMQKAIVKHFVSSL